MSRTPLVRFAPVAALQRFIIELQVVPASGQTKQRIHNLPDGTQNLLFRLRRSGQGDLTILGTRTRAVQKDSGPHALVVNVRFQPGGAFPFFGCALSEISDRSVSLDEIWGSEGIDLCELLVATDAHDEHLHLIQAALLRRVLRAEPSQDNTVRTVQRAIGLMRRESQNTAALAASLGISMRHLRRLFHQSVGIGPKQFSRIVRFQRAIAGLAENKDGALLAGHAGYYDQSHMTGEFRSLCGMTPGAFVRRARANASE